MSDFRRTFDSMTGSLTAPRENYKVTFVYVLSLVHMYAVLFLRGIKNFAGLWDD